MLGARIKRARIEAGLSQHQFGLRVGVTGQTIYRWEKGEMTPRVELLRRISEETGRNLEWFHGDEAA